MFSQDGEWSSKSFFFDEPLNLKYPHIRRAGSSLNVERSVHVVLVH